MTRIENWVLRTGLDLIRLHAMLWAYGFYLLWNVISLRRHFDVLSPLSIVFHLALLVAIAYHAFTWFKLFPLTMPPVVVDGKKVAPEVIVRSGFTAAIVCAVGLLALVWRIAA